MKRIFTLIVLMITFGMSVNAQKSYINYSKDSRWFFGLNGGATWHTKTEVDNVIRGGYGFTFGRSFGMKPEKLFSWDLRLRYLHGWWGGQNTSQYTLDSTTTTELDAYGTSLQNYQDSTGYFIPNFRTQLMSGSLELALNTNRLRENTGWNFQIFGGIGIKGYNSKADLLNGTQPYDYDNMNTSSQVNILKEQDGNYETYVTGGDADFFVDWMGSFGVGISYQVSPWASIGIGHKMTWTRNDDKFDILPGTGNDIYHYSNAGIKFHLFGGNHTTVVDPIVEDTTPVNIDNFDNNNNITPTPVQKPIVDIYDPGSSPYTVDYDHFTIRARVHHVAGKQNITFKQNGNVNNNFSYNATSDEFASNVILQPGQNIFEITGVNSAGQDYESTIIIYKKDVPKIEPPIVTITNPPYSPYTTPNSAFNFAATVLNVDSKSQIKVYFNGQYLSNFTYNVTSKALYATLNLQEGTNTVTVTATNTAGSDSKTATIIYEKPQVKQPPVVDFVIPSADPYSTTNPSMNITATVLNVDGKNDIKVIVNGFVNTNFNYNSTTKQVTFPISLIEGANIVDITGTNSVGSDKEVTTIIYNRPEVPKPPVVTYLDPITDPTVVYSSSYNVVAQVLNVNSASDITLKINGIQSYNFAYSASSKQMTFTTNLLIGSNVIEITATNNAGQDSETTTIIRKKMAPKAPPVVEITYTATDNQVFNSPNITVLASVLNVNSAADIQVWVNGNITNGFNYNIATKVLSLPISMVEGTNTIKVTGTNSAGSSSDIRKIIYKKPVKPTPPTVSFVNPPSSPYLVNTQNYTITANTTNIDSKSQINLLYNGSLVPNGFYSLTANKQIIFNTDLIPGNNVFEITVTNQDGSDNAMAIVTYKEDEKPCIIPTVGYISPVPYSTVNDANVTIDAQINNWSADTDVELFLNGVSQGLMAYNSGTSIASLSATLLEGSNAIKVQVSNKCGRNHATFTLNYIAPEAPCIDPILTANSPVSSTTQNSSISLQAGVSEITAANQVTVTLNGSAVPFQFDQGTGTITIDNVQLALGNNTVLVKATNDCGTAMISFNIVREECKLPTISNPSHASGSTSNNPSITFTASVANALANEIELVVNNISQPFNFTNGVLSSGINLQEGANTIVINATNACGKASKSHTITYEVPCVPITVSYVSPASNQATVTSPNFNIQLHVNGTLASSGVSATVNGTNVAATYDAVTGDISISGITLQDGVNTIVLNLKNDCSTERITYTITYNGCKPPVINISNLTSGATVNTSTVDLNAVIQNSNGAANIELKVNGTTQSFNFDDQSNVLTSTIDLVEGSNTIVITVNGCEVKSKSINLTYTIPCQNISYNLMTPASNSQTVVSSSYAISLSLQEVANQQQISVKLNGNAIPFTYDQGTHVLNITGITLVDGANTIVVTATNACSSETITYNIQYNGCKPPVITLGANATNVEQAAYSFSASVTNISNQSEIQVLFNNAPINFVFNSQNGSITGDVTLVEGPNTIKITANGCATDSKSFTVTYKPKVEDCKPTVSGTFSSDNKSATANSTKDLSNVVLKFHDGTTQKFDGLSGLTGTFAGTGQHEGKCIVGMWIKSGCNQSNDGPGYGEYVPNTGFSGTCDQKPPCDPPVITTSGNLTSVTVANYTFAATVTNVNAASDVVVKLNGQVVQHTYTGGAVTASMTLVEGTNNISIEANGCEKVSETLDVTYKIPCNPVDFTLGSPNTEQLVVNGNTTNVSLNVSNVTAKSDITVELNGSPVNFTFANNVINVQNISLIEGANTLVVSFKNACSSKSVTYTIESNQCDSPIITVSNNNITTNDPLYTFTCNVQHITNGSDITVKVNGQVVQSNFANGVVTAQMSLQEGPNEVIVTAKGCKTVSVTYNVIYQKPCDPITFTLVKPNSADTVYQTTNSATIQLNAAHVQQSGITVKLNGNSIPFTFANGVITISTQTLVTGTNSINVHMTNDCSNADQSFFYVVGAPCNPPVINVTSSSTTVDNPAYNFTATVTNVNAASDIVLKLNGQVVQHNYSNGNVTANLTLIEGANNIVIEARGCQTASKVHTVTYTPKCNPPVITVTSGTATESASYVFTATVTNVNSASDITVKLNGQAVQHTYSNGTVTANVTLAEGPNSFMVQANGCAPALGKHGVLYTAACDGPVISVTSATATETAAYTFSATVTNVSGGSAVVVKHNGNVVQHTYNNGTVSVSLTLAEGANTFTVQANGCSTANASHNVTYTIKPCGPRFNPGNSAWQFCLVTSNATYTRDDLASNSNFTYSGPASAVYFKPIAGGGDAIVNGQPYTLQNGNYYLFEGNLTVDVSSSHPGSMGHWEICLTSNANPTYGNGNNRPPSPCESKNTNNDGGNTNNTINGGGTTNNSQEAKPPTIVNLNPTTTSYTSKTEDYTFKVKLGNVPAKSNITLNVNGAATTSFTYDASSGVLSHDFKLKSGPNTIKVDVENGGKKANRSYTVTYKPATNTGTTGGNVGTTGGNVGTTGGNVGTTGGTTTVNTTVLAPKITNISPTTLTSTVNAPTLTFKAQVDNVKSKGEISLTLNGVNVPAFTYSSSNKQVTAVLKLNTGKNVINLTATSSGKKATRSYSVTYTPVTNSGGSTDKTVTIGGTTPGVQSPAITKVAPNSSTFTSTSAKYTFQAKVTNVTSKAGIQLIVNGSNFTNFSFNAKTGYVTAVIDLKNGANSIRLIGKNTANTATENFTITYSAPVQNSGGTIKTGVGTSGGNTNGGTTNGGTTGTKTTNGGTTGGTTGTKTTNGGTNTGGTTNGGTKTIKVGGGTTNGGSGSGGTQQGGGTTSRRG